MEVFAEWNRILRETLNCSAVADWLNRRGVPVGPHCRRTTWDGAMVRRVTRNPLLKGRPGRGFKHTVKHHETGRRVSVPNPDGPVFRDKWATWRSQSGARWPGLHEFEIGCTLEHAGYALSWLVSLFGAVENLTAFSAITFPDKGPGTEKITMAPDFSVGCLQFRSGVIGRLTSGLAAPRDRSLTIVGDKGSIVVADLWDNRSAVYLEELGKARKLTSRLAIRLEGWLKLFLPWKPGPGRRLPYPAGKRKPHLPAFPSQIDFCRGIAAQAQAIADGKRPLFSGSRALHITEIALALNNAGGLPQPYHVQTTF